MLYPKDWLLIAPNGVQAIARRPLDAVPTGARIASGGELLSANRGNPFPWGHTPEPNPNNLQWSERRIGVGGLIHDRWFVTIDGRFGGAPNVPQMVPGSLRCCLYLDGGLSLEDGVLAENEGYAAIRPTTTEDQALYRRVTLYAATHVMADGGAIVMSPIGDDRKVYVGFVGRCQICPNAELISFEQLKRSVPEYDFQLWDEWKGWRVGNSRHTHSSAQEAMP